MAEADKGKQVPPQLEDAIDFVNEVKIRFSDEVHKFETFLGLFNDYREGKMSMEKIEQETRLLLQGEPDLLRTFIRFLPAELNPKD